MTPRERREARCRLLSTADAALALGIAPATVRDWRRRGLITPASGVGRTALYDVDELVSAAEARKPRRESRRTA